MVMGTATSEKCSQNTVNGHSAEGQIQRPLFYPCTDCGRKFTKRALKVHRLSCSENEYCQCAVCKITKGNFFKDEEENMFIDSSEPSPKRMKKELFRNELRDFLKKSFQKNVPQSESNEVPDRENPGEPVDSALGDRQFFLICSDPPNSENSSFKNETNSIQSSLESVDRNHGGEVCNRKLFCCVCKDHVFWESFGTHALQHCAKSDNDHLLCPECSDSRSSPTYFLMHFYSHISAHPSDCPECRCEHPKCLDGTANELPEHCYAESNDHRCYICLKYFSHFQTLINHMRLHSKEMPFSCRECKRSFRQIGNLQRHMTTHRGDRPHKCPKCCRSFADPATLRNHVRVHTRETPYVCTICNRGFSQVGNLKRHMALHVRREVNPVSVKITKEEKSFTLKQDGTAKDEALPTNSEKVKSTITDCPSGNDGAAYDDVSAESSQTVTPQDVRDTMGTGARRGKKSSGNFNLHVCSKCGKKYTWKHDLDIHFRTHTGEKPYGCEICEKRFAQSGAVRIHKIRHHPNGTLTRVRSKQLKV